MGLMPKAAQLLTDSQVTNSTNHYGFKAVRETNGYNTSDHEQLSQMSQSANERESAEFPNARAMTLN